MDNKEFKNLFDRIAKEYGFKTLQATVFSVRRTKQAFR